MTPAQLAEELERKLAEITPPPTEELDPSTVTASGSRPVVVTGQATAPSAGPVDLNRRTATPMPPVRDDVELSAPSVVTGKAVPTTPAPAPVGLTQRAASVPSYTEQPALGVPDTESQPQSFADLIMQNDAVRLRNKEAFDRREKADKARLTIAAVTDALASLGNLVGTTQGAFSQPQTYQVPFVHEDAERARAEARNTANMLLRNDQSLRVAQMREDSANSAAALRQALEEERTRRAQMNNDARVALAQENARLKGELYEKQHGYRTEEQDQKFADQKQIADDRNRTTLQAAGVRAGATKYAADKRAENSVGGYTKTETETVSRDEYGNVTGKSKTTTRSPNGGPSTTTTTGSSGKKPNPMGSAPKQEGKKKKKNPMA